MKLLLKSVHNGIKVALIREKFFGMKRFSVMLFSLLIFAVLASCSGQKVPPELFQRQWMLTSFKNYSYDFLVKNRAQLDLAPTKSENHRYNAFLGCNKLFLNAIFKPNGKAVFSDVGSTLMFCEGDAMKLENDFARQLPKMNHYKIEGHQMTLTDSEGNTMKFVAADWD